VRVADDEWSAVATTGSIARGSPIRVQRVDGIRLIVEGSHSREQDPPRAREKEEAS
jgi:membrane-bound ClpP family serine protease